MNQTEKLQAVGHFKQASQLKKIFRRYVQLMRGGSFDNRLGDSVHHVFNKKLPFPTEDLKVLGARGGTGALGGLGLLHLLRSGDEAE